MLNICILRQIFTGNWIPLPPSSFEYINRCSVELSRLWSDFGIIHSPFGDVTNTNINSSKKNLVWKTFASDFHPSRTWALTCASERKFSFFLLPRDYTTFLYWCSYFSLSASRFVGRAYYVLKLLWNSSPADDKRHYLITETMSGKSGSVGVGEWCWKMKRKTMEWFFPGLCRCLCRIRQMLVGD